MLQIANIFARTIFQERLRVACSPYSIPARRTCLNMTRSMGRKMEESKASPRILAHPRTKRK